jgi:hypothetical protein
MQMKRWARAQVFEVARDKVARDKGGLAEDRGVGQEQVSMMNDMTLTEKFFIVC